MSTTKIIIAGFGGQGILFTGKLMAYQGMIAGRYVSWLPSYGPEVRGGTCNCSVIVSDEPIGSPIIDNPDIVIAMNRPSLDKYEPMVAKGGKLFIESSLIDRKAERHKRLLHSGSGDRFRKRRQPPRQHGHPRQRYEQERLLPV